MPSRWFLNYATTNIIINELRDGFNKDKDLYYTDGNAQTRINVPKILDGWNYTIRDYPSIIMPAMSGVNRRMGIGDYAAIPYFGVSGAEDKSLSTATYRKFIVSGVLAPGTQLHAIYNTPDGGTAPSITEWDVIVRADTVDPTIRYIELTGTNIGPYGTFPAQNFSFISNTPTAEQYGGFYDLRQDIFVVTLSQVEREIVTDRVWSLLWWTKKRELLYKGVVVLDINLSGMTQEDMGADKIYVSRMSLSCATEFRQLVYYLDTVEGVTIHGEAVLPPTI